MKSQYASEAKFFIFLKSCFKKLKKVLAVTSHNVNIICQTEATQSGHNSALYRVELNITRAWELGLRLCPLAVISFSTREKNKITN